MRQDDRVGQGHGRQGGSEDTADAPVLCRVALVLGVQGALGAATGRRAGAIRRRSGGSGRGRGAGTRRPLRGCKGAVGRLAALALKSGRARDAGACKGRCVALRSRVLGVDRALLYSLYLSRTHAVTDPPGIVESWAGELSHSHLPRRSAALRTLSALCAMGGERAQLWSVLLPLLEEEVRVGELAGQAKGGSGWLSCCGWARSVLPLRVCVSACLRACVSAYLRANLLVYLSVSVSPTSPTPEPAPPHPHLPAPLPEQDSSPPSSARQSARPQNVLTSRPQRSPRSADGCSQRAPAA